jgi:D-arabinose 1-dehydrogenase-like Zn-dependent alcohol dehydrogenase
MGGIDFTVYKGSSPDGTIIEARGHRDGLGPTEALVKITHSGVCGTDEHVRTRDQGLGHEGVGIIQDLGPAVPPEANLKVGDRVGMGLLQRFCGYCTPCLKGK